MEYDSTHTFYKASYFSVKSYVRKNNNRYQYRNICLLQGLTIPITAENDDKIATNQSKIQPQTQFMKHTIDKTIWQKSMPIIA